MQEKLTYMNGRIIWKSHAEYNPHGVLHGMPYYYITEVNETLYLWKYDIEKKDYVQMKSGDDFGSMHEEGMSLDDEIGERRRKQREAGMNWDEIL